MAQHLGSKAAKEYIQNLSREREMSEDTKVESSSPGDPCQPLLHKSRKALNLDLLRKEASAMIKPQRSHKNYRR